MQIDLLKDAAEARRLRGENVRLSLEVAKLRKANTRLANRLREKSNHTKLLEQARIDADLILTLHTAGLPISRAYCESVGLPRRRWARVRRLLLVAGVLVGRHIVDVEHEVLIAAIDNAYERARIMPKTFWTRHISSLLPATPIY